MNFVKRIWGNIQAKKSKHVLRKIDWQLHLLVWLPLLFLIVFTYIPMAGLRLAFVDECDYTNTLWGGKFVGFEWFRYMFTEMGAEFWRAMRNTLLIATLKLILGFPVPILVTLLLNEVLCKPAKKTLQTVYFLPYFLSWVTLAGIMQQMFRGGSVGGLFDRFLELFGYSGEKVWLQENFSFVTVMIFSDIWKGFGYGTIIYLAALTSIDPALYEAAAMDGANKFHQAVYVTLPSIMPMIVLNLIMNLGSVLNANFDQIVNLYSPHVYEWGDIIDTLVYRYSLGSSSPMYPLSTAIGLFKSVVALILICTSNFLVKKTTEYQIF